MPLTVLLPLAGSPPMASTSHGGHLQVVLVNLKGEGAVQLVLDRDGRTVAMSPVPLAYPVGLAACDGELHLTGALRGTDDPAHVVLDPAGGSGQPSPLAVSGTLVRWPRPVCIQRLAIVWETSDQRSSKLWIREMGGVDSGATAGISLEGYSSLLDFAASGPTLNVLRVSGSRAELQLIRFGGDHRRVSDQIIADGVTAVSLASTPSLAAVAWVELGRRLCVAWAEPGGRLGPAGILFEAEAGTELTSPRVLLRHDGQAAVLCRVARRGPSGGAVQQGPPQPLTREELAIVVRPHARVAASLSNIDPPGSGGGTGGWLDDRLIVLHGSLEPALTVFEFD